MTSSAASIAEIAPRTDENIMHWSKLVRVFHQRFCKDAKFADRVSYRHDVYELLNRTSSWIAGAAVSSGLVQ